MEYLYSVTCSHDGEAQPRWIGRFSDCLSAVECYQRFVDWGTAATYSTINLSEPNGKMHTKTFYKSGEMVAK